MPNTKGGKKYKRGKNHNSGNRETRIAQIDDGEMYAKAGKALGNRRFIVNVFPNNEERIAKVAGGIAKRCFVKQDDYVLVSARECDTKNNSIDIIHKYSKEDVDILYKQGNLKTISNDDNNEINFTSVEVNSDDNDSELCDDDINNI